MTCWADHNCIKLKKMQINYSLPFYKTAESHPWGFHWKATLWSWSLRCVLQLLNPFIIRERLEEKTHAAYTHKQSIDRTDVYKCTRHVEGWRKGQQSTQEQVGETGVRWPPNHYVATTPRAHQCQVTYGTGGPRTPLWPDTKPLAGRVCQGIHSLLGCGVLLWLAISGTSAADDNAT